MSLDNESSRDANQSILFATRVQLYENAPPRC